MAGLLIHNFNPRSPCGERLDFSQGLDARLLFQPTLPVRGATVPSASHPSAGSISTHAPRAGSDVRQIVSGVAWHDFNPRSPCGERRPSGRGGRGGRGNFNPRSPCGERLGVLLTTAKDIIISTHAPRAGSDKEQGYYDNGNIEFQPTLPVRGATYCVVQYLCSFRFQPTLPVRGATDIDALLARAR